MRIPVEAKADLLGLIRQEKGLEAEKSTFDTLEDFGVKNVHLLCLLY